MFPVVNRAGETVGLIQRRYIIYAIKYTEKYGELEDAEEYNAGGPNNTLSAALKRVKQDWNDTTDYSKLLKISYDGDSYYHWVKT